MKIKELNTILENLLEDIRNIDYDKSIANSRYAIKDEKGNILEKGYWQVKSGTTICGYLFKDSQNQPLLLSKQVAEFLKEVHEEYHGTGMVSSVMDSHSGNPNSPTTHPSGNCIDFGLGMVGYNAEGVYKIAAPVVQHQAVVEFWFESKLNDSMAAKTSVAVKEKLKLNGFATSKVGYREISWASGYHIHVVINPDLLKQKPTEQKDYL